MEIVLPSGASRGDFRMKSPLLQMIPEGVHVRDVEDKPPPVTYPVTLFQIEDRRLGVFCAQRREIRVFSPIEKLHPQDISVKPHGFCHVRNAERDRGNLFNRRRMHEVYLGLA